MSKLVYPKEGLYNHSKVITDQVDEFLERAAGKSDFDVPEEFKYAGYLNGFGNMIQEFKNENHAIADEIRQVDKYYSDLSNELTNSVRALTIQKLTRRDRMIV